MKWRKLFPEKKKRKMPVQKTFETSPTELFTEPPGRYFVEINVKKGITNLLGIPLEDSPFVRTLKLYSQGECPVYEGSPLKRFYADFQPQSMAEVLGLDHPEMHQIPAMATVMPWWPDDPATMLRRVAHDPEAKILLGIEALHFGVRVEGNYGWQYFGPLSQDVAEMEFTRLINVYESIKKHGYRLKRGIPIHGEFLISGDDWVWVALGGKHRMSALVALGWDCLPVTTKARYGSHMVERDQVESWPNVVSGLFTVNEALAVFDARLASHKR